MNIYRDGKLIDTLENFRWPLLVGGPSDGEQLPSPKCWDQKEIEVGEETYVRRRWSSVGAPARVIAFVAKEMPKELHWPYALHRRIYNSHPQLEKMADIRIDTKRKDSDGAQARKA